MRPGLVVKGAEVVNDFRFYLYTVVQLWHARPEWLVIQQLWNMEVLTEHPG